MLENKKNDEFGKFINIFLIIPCTQNNDICIIQRNNIIITC